MELKSYSREISYEVSTLEHLITRTIIGIVQMNNYGDLTIMQAWIMQYLYDHRNSEVYQKDIESHFCITRSTVTSILQLMEKKGYIRRTSVMKDARLKRINLTAKAVAIQKKNSYEIHQNFEKMMRENIDSHELDIFFGCIDRIRQNLEKSSFLEPAAGEGKESRKKRVEQRKQTEQWRKISNSETGVNT